MRTNKSLLFLLATGLSVTLTAGENKVECKAAGKPCCEDAAKAALKTVGKAESPYSLVQLKLADVGCEESCGKLSQTIASLQGVKEQSVCSQSQVALIRYEAGKTCSKTLTAALQKAGYKIEGQQVSLKVNGMTCGGCASGLGKTIAKLEGVKTADVCHESGTAQVLFDPIKLDSSSIVAAITKSGYTVEK